MGTTKKWLKGSRAFMGMVFVQLISTGLQILSRVILSEGTFVFALMTYRHIVAALCIAPFAFFLEGSSRKKVNWWVGVWIFISALSGITMGMGMFYYGLRDTNATYATNFLNLIPIVTFLFSTLARIEKLELGNRRGKVKVGGAIACVGGGLVISLYHGYAFHLSYHKEAVILNNSNPHWTRGTFFLVGSCLSYAAWFIVQAKLVKHFSSKYWTTMLTCMAASVETATFGLCIDRRKSSWKLGWNLQLITIIYSGALASAASFYLITWTVSKRGPTYPPMFNPLSLLFVALLEFFFLDQDLSLGSLLGMALIILGLYSFLWGGRTNSKETTLPKMGPSEPTMAGLESQGLQGTATVVPTTSPISHSTIEETEIQTFP